VKNIFSELTIQIILVFLGILSLGLAIWGGLVRIGWHFPPLISGMPGIHGPLVVCGFLGTLFSLERAMALHQRWGYIVPSLNIMGAFILLIDPMGDLSRYVLLAGSALFILLCWKVFQVRANIFNGMTLVGSFLWLSGIIIWLAGWPVFNVYLWWMGFVLFTIVGQRLELAHRIHLAPKPYWMIVLALSIVFIGQMLMAVGHILSPDSIMDIYMDAIVDARIKLGMQISGIGMVATALWLLRYDAAWSLIRNGGMAGYTSLCLLSGYTWLAFSGIFSYIFAGLVSGVRYDALIHAFFIGFVFFDIFAHSPIMILTQLGVRVRFSPLLIFHIVLLHGALLTRILGDLLRNMELTKYGGLLNSLVILFFMLSMGSWIWKDKRSQFLKLKKEE